MKMLKWVFLLVLILGTSVAGICFAQSDFPSLSFTTGVGNVSNMAGFRLPALNIEALKMGDPTSSTAGDQKYVEVAPPDGASFMVSSVPVEIQVQVRKNIFPAHIPNGNLGRQESLIPLAKLGEPEIP